MAALVRLVSAALILSHHALTTAVHTRPLSSRRGTTEAPRVAAPSSLPRRSLSETPVCCGAPKVCTGPAFQGVSERQLFFVHPVPNSSGLSWYDHDMADALGDATFMCVDQSFVKTYNDTLVSSVHMRWSNAYVNYAECDDRDGGTCIFGDGNGTGVGRVNPFFWPGKGNACGFAAGTGKTGQCWTNLTGGQWFRSVLSPAATASAAAARAMRCGVGAFSETMCVRVRACVRACAACRSQGCAPRGPTWARKVARGTRSAVASRTKRSSSSACTTMGWQARARTPPLSLGSGAPLTPRGTS
jgi:hypothetical protein